MARDFLSCDREQEMLLPPSLREWLPAGHLVWFVLDVVAGLDLDGIVGEYRVGGAGRAAHEPRMMVALLLYAYAVGERSSRAIERRCQEEVPFRVITANRAPDHTTIARFRARHDRALADLFEQVLALCARAGLVRVGRVALDGTKLAANAGMSANRRYRAIRAEVERMLADAAAIDAAEDQQFGDARGDELPAELADPRSRRARLERAKAELEAEQQARQAEHDHKLARRQEHRARTGKNPSGRAPKPPDPDMIERGKRNITDPDSRIMSARGAHLQAYNAQAVVGEGQVIIAAQVTNSPNDHGQLEPMITAARQTLAAIDHHEAIKCVLADSGYWNNAGIAAVRHDKTTVIVPTSDPHHHNRQRAPRGGPEAPRIHKILATPAGRRLYRRRAAIVEPVFAHTKHRRGIDRFSRRGLTAANREWKLIAATHNLLKLFRAQPQPA